MKLQSVGYAVRSITANVEACRSAPVRLACVSGRIEASVCCTPPFHSLKR